MRYIVNSLFIFQDVNKNIKRKEIGWYTLYTIQWHTGSHCVHCIRVNARAEKKDRNFSATSFINAMHFGVLVLSLLMHRFHIFTGGHFSLWCFLASRHISIQSRRVAIVLYVCLCMLCTLYTVGWCGCINKFDFIVSSCQSSLKVTNGLSHHHFVCVLVFQF